MNSKIQHIFIVVVFFLISGCEFKPEFNYEFPRVTTTNVSSLPEKGATLNAKIDFQGTGQIITRGFLWGTSNDLKFPKDSIAIEGENSSDKFSCFVDYALPKGQSIYYCGFVKTSNHLVYGNIATFQSEGANEPKITSLSTQHGTDGDTIEINGNYFTQVLSSYQPAFGTRIGKVIRATKTKLTVQLPVNYTVSENVNLKLKIHDKWYSVGDFKLDSLYLKEISKSSASILSELEIHFNSHIHTVDKLMIGNAVIQNFSFQGKTLKIIIPYDASLGDNQISGIINKKSFSSDQMVQVNSSWKRKKDCPEVSINRVTNCAYSINNNAYFYLSALNGGTTNSFWLYNPLTDIWYKLTTISGGYRSNTFAFTINQKAYWGAGESYIIDSDKFETYEYDPKKKELKTVANLRSFFAEYTNITKLHSAFGIGIGNKGYLFGGTTQVGTPLPYFYYDQLSNTWKQINTFESITGFKYWWGMTGFEINGEIYVGSGYTNQGATSKFWKYNPENDQWTSIADHPGGERYLAVGFSINGKGYVGLGEKNYGGVITYYKDFYEYNPSLNEWKRIPDFPGAARSGAAATVCNNKAYVGLGGANKDLWEFTP